MKTSIKILLVLAVFVGLTNLPSIAQITYVENTFTTNTAAPFRYPATGFSNAYLSVPSINIGGYVGTPTLPTAATGLNNLHVGIQAGFNIFGASASNTFLGTYSGHQLSQTTEIYRNTFVGTGASGEGTKSGSDNTFVGFVSGNSVTSGRSNSLLGSMFRDDGTANTNLWTSGSYNSAIGAGVAIGENNNGADSTVSIGAHIKTFKIASVSIGAAVDNQGSHATVIGSRSIASSHSDFATVVGYSSAVNDGSSNGANSYITILGSRTRVGMTGSNAIIVGNLLGTININPNTIIFGAENGTTYNNTSVVPSIGIGTYSPSAKVHIKSLGNTSSTDAFIIENSSSSSNTLIHVRNDKRFGFGTNDFTNSHFHIGDLSGGSGTNQIRIDNLPTKSTFNNTIDDILVIDNSNIVHRFIGSFSGSGAEISCDSPMSGIYPSTSNTVDKYELPYLSGSGFYCSMFEQQDIAEDCEPSLVEHRVAGVDWNNPTNPNLAIPGYWSAYNPTTDTYECYPITLAVNGNTLSETDFHYSDRDLKTNIKQIEVGSEVIKRLKPVTFNFLKENKYHLNVGTAASAGFIAQDLEKVLPHLVATTDLGFKAINYEGIIPYMVTAIQENITLVETKTKKIEELEDVLNKQKDEIENLKNIVAQLAEKGGIKIEQSQLISSESDTPQLYQNYPNPFNQDAKIIYYLPSGCNNSQIQIINSKAEIVKQIKLNDTGKSEIKIGAGSLLPGTYFYRLICNDKLEDEKKMTIVK